jgi:DNA replication protein DnaC
MTSNLNMEKIIENYDARIVDRIIELSEIIEITGKSRRSSSA